VSAHLLGAPDFHALFQPYAVQHQRGPWLSLDRIGPQVALRKRPLAGDERPLQALGVGVVVFLDAGDTGAVAVAPHRPEPFGAAERAAKRGELLDQQEQAAGMAQRLVGWPDLPGDGVKPVPWSAASLGDRDLDGLAVQHAAGGREFLDGLDVAVGQRDEQRRDRDEIGGHQEQVHGQLSASFDPLGGRNVRHGRDHAGLGDLGQQPSLLVMLRRDLLWGSAVALGQPLPGLDSVPDVGDLGTQPRDKPSEFPSE
jgi:hypothetical protein